MTYEYLTAVTYKRDHMRTAELRRPRRLDSWKPDQKARVRQGWVPPLP